MANNAKEARNQNMARGPVSTEWTGILGTVGNKETYPVDMFLAGFLTKNDRPQNGR